VLQGKTDRLTPRRSRTFLGSRRSDLQGMRAVAVLAVFGDHLFDWPSSGFVGVDVFFVLSGFFITGLLIRERITTGKLSFQQFYVRRVKRILPSAVLVLAATVIGSYLLFPAMRAKETLVDALYAAVFAANFHFEAVGAEYFQQGQPPSPLQHYWSLSIEEQFYFVWPVVLVLIFALTRGFRPRENRWARQWGLFGAMAVVVAASFGWAMILSADDPNRAYFSTFTRVWELGVGALVAIAGRWLVHLPSAIRPVLAYLGVAGVLGSLFLINTTDPFPAPWAAWPVLSTALVVASFHGAEVRGMAPLTNPVARYLGDTSYTLYLWHWPVTILLLTVMPKGPWFYGIALALALGLTAVTYHFYEDPIRKSDWLLNKPHSKNRRKPTLTPSRWAVIGVLMVLVIVLSILGIRRDELSHLSQDDYQSDVADLMAPVLQTNPCLGAPAMLTSGCVLWNPDVPLKPSIAGLAEETRRAVKLSHGAYECFRRRTEKVVKPCIYGYRGEDATRIALVGDSHAAAIIPALWPVLVANKWQLTTYVGEGCQWRMSPWCPIAEIQQQLLAHHYDVVLTTSFRKTAGDARDFQQTWAPIAAAGSRIAVLLDNPSVSEDFLDCLTRVNLVGHKTGDCSTSREEAFAYPDPLIAAADLMPGATLIDLTPYYCTADRCPSVIGNVIVYRDTEAHLSESFARTLAPAIEKEVRRALGT
jgi:peptidoglycan/LPS O-acetylase OafA/YrhL